MNKLNSLKERIKKNFKENKVLFIVFTILWMAVIVGTLVFFDSTIGKQSIGNESYNRSVVEVDNNTVVTEVVQTENDAESVSILFATYARINEGKINIKVTGVNSNIEYANNEYDVKSIQDNAYVTIRLNSNLDTKKDKYLRIVITSNSENGKAVGVYYSNAKAFDGSKLTINNEVIEEADLCFKYLVNNPELRSFANSVIIWSIIGITFIVFLVLFINPKLEVLFAVTIFILGLIMMIIIVPASPPDELSHYEVTLQLSNMILGKDVKTIDSIYMKYGYMYGHYNISPGYVRFINEINGPLKLTGDMQTIDRNIDGLYLFQYLPSTIGILLGRIFGLNMITTLYFGRFTTLLFYSSCIYIAIKKAPSYKFLFGILSCLPMFSQISISISSDAFIVGLSFIIIAYFMNWFFIDKKISNKELVFAFLVCLAIAPAKVLYSFFAFLFLFVPASRYGGKKLKIFKCILLCAPSIYQLYGIMNGPLQLFFHSVLDSNSKNLISLDGVKTLNNDTNVTTFRDAVVPTEVYSFSYMIKHPIETIMIFVRTIRYRIKYWYYGSIGRGLSGETLILPLTIVHLMVGITFVSAFIKQEYVLPISNKVLMVVLCIVVGLYAMIGMFVSWTAPSQSIVQDYGGVIVEGLQGRYFSPLLPYFYSIFANKKIALPKKTEKYVLLAYLLIFFVITVYVLSYTFVN